MNTRIFPAIFALTAAVSFAGLANGASLSTKTQHFDVNPGWTTVGSGVNGNNFGYQTTSFAGGSSGEGGGKFTRSNFVKYYADTNLGGTITLNDPFSASGKLDYTSAFQPDFGYTNMLGHFDTGGLGRIGIGINYDGFITYWTPVVTLNDFTTLSAPTAFTQIAPNVDRTWSYSWDPNGGLGFGRLTTVLDGVSHTIDLTAAERATGATTNAFGFAGLAGPSSDSSMFANIYFDDVMYSALPEPSTIVLGGFGLISLIGFAVRPVRVRSRNE